MPSSALAVILVLAACSTDYKLDEGDPRIIVSPILLDFGAVAIGDEVGGEVTLTSVDGGAVTVVSADLLGDDAFEVGAMPIVPGGGAATFPVTFHPTEAGWQYARLTLTTDEPDENTHVVDLRGRSGDAGVQVWPGVLDFGPVAAGGSATRTFTVLNDGEVDLTLAEAQADSALFATVSTVPADVGAGASIAVEVGFAPQDEAEATGTLSLDLGLSWTPMVTLRGNACATGDPAQYDADGDGFTACASDCDDADADTRPGGVETCDGKDEDCDGTVDEGTSCADDDGDGATEDAGDCNDGDADVGPGETERLGNGVDDDCDGVVDDGTADDDGDGYTLTGGDCDLADATVYPGAPELPDGQDNDCDGITDEGTSLYDDDRDGFTEADGDCDDSDGSTSPGATETADWLDDDCDGDVDEGTDNGDDDGDGFTETGGDCDDGDAAVNPGAAETTGNRTDDDCDGVTE